MPELATGVEIRYEAWDDNGNHVEVESENPSGNSVAFNINLDSLDQNSIHQQLRVYAHNEFGQEFSTFYNADGVTPAPLSLEALIVGQTKYFANSLGGTGYRNYAADGSYTGSVTLGNGTTFATSGTYEVSGNVLTVNRTSPSPTTLVLSYMGEEEGGLGFSITVNGGKAFETYSFATAAERDDSLTDFTTLLTGQTLYQVWYGTGTDTDGNDIDNVAVVAKVTFNLNGTAEYVGLMNEESGSGKWEVTDGKLVLVALADSFDYTEYNQYVSGDIASGCIQTNWINENDPNDNNIDLFFTDETVALNFANNLTDTAHCP